MKIKPIYILAIGGVILFVLYSSGYLNRFIMRTSPLPQYKPSPMAGPIPRGNITLPMHVMMMTPHGPMPTYTYVDLPQYMPAPGPGWIPHGNITLPVEV